MPRPLLRVGQIGDIVHDLFPPADDLHQSADGAPADGAFEFFVGLFENILEFERHVVFADFGDAQVVAVFLDQVLKGFQRFDEAVFEFFDGVQVLQVDREIDAGSFDGAFGVIDHLGIEHDVVGDEDDVVVVVQQVDVLQGNVDDLAPVLADAHIVADTQLAGKCDDHAVDHVGDVIFRQDGQTGENDGEGGKYFFYFQPEQRHQPDHHARHQHQRINVADADHEIVVAPQAVAPAVHPNDKKLHEIQRDQEYGDAGQGDGVVLQRIAVAVARVVPEYVPLAQADQDEYDQQGGLEQ